MIIFTLNLYAKERLSNKSLKLEITSVRVQTLTEMKSLKRDLLDSPLKSLLGVAYALTFIKGLRKNITP